MSLTQNGKDTYRSTLGGLVSIVIGTFTLVYGTLQMYTLFYHPVYNQLPPEYDYDYNKNIEVDWSLNMVSYMLIDPNLNDPLETLRVVFQPEQITNDVIPAVYCKDYYADEIAAEKNDQSNSTFYTDKYGFLGDYGQSMWICPNLTSSLL